jgi:hypothetical protein
MNLLLTMAYLNSFDYMKSIERMKSYLVWKKSKNMDW